MHINMIWHDKYQACIGRYYLPGCFVIYQYKISTKHYTITQKQKSI